MAEFKRQLRGKTVVATLTIVWIGLARSRQLVQGTSNVLPADADQTTEGPQRTLLQSSATGAGVTTPTASPANTGIVCNQSISDAIIAMSAGYGFSWLPRLLAQGVLDPYMDPNYSATVFLTLESITTPTCKAPSGALVLISDLFPASPSQNGTGGAALAGYLNRIVQGYHCVSDLVEAGSLNTLLGEHLGISLPLNFTLSPQGKAVISFGQYQTEIVGSRDVCGKSMLHIINNVIWPWTEYWGLPSTGLPAMPTDFNVSRDMAAMGVILPPLDVEPPPGVCHIPARGCQGVEPRVCLDFENLRMMTSFDNFTLPPVVQDCTPLLTSGLTALPQAKLDALLAVPNSQTPPSNSTQQSSSSNTGLIIGLSVGITVAVVLSASVVGIFIWRGRRSNLQGKQDTADKEFWDAIAKATDHRSDAADDSSAVSRPNMLWRVKNETETKAKMMEITGCDGAKSVPTVPLTAMLCNYGLFSSAAEDDDDGLDKVVEEEQDDKGTTDSPITGEELLGSGTPSESSSAPAPGPAGEHRLISPALSSPVLEPVLLTSGGARRVTWRSASVPNPDQTSGVRQATMLSHHNIPIAPEPQDDDLPVAPSADFVAATDQQQTAAADVDQQQHSENTPSGLQPMWGAKTAPTQVPPPATNTPNTNATAVQAPAAKPNLTSALNSGDLNTTSCEAGLSGKRPPVETESPDAPLFQHSGTSGSRTKEDTQHNSRASGGMNSKSSRRVISQLFRNNSNDTQGTTTSSTGTPTASMLRLGHNSLPQSLQEIFIPPDALSVMLDDKGDPSCEGQGGFGTVFRGLWGKVQVAIKLPGGASMMVKGVKGDRREQQQLLREVAHMRELDHPHLLRLLGLSYLGSNLVLVTPYKEGGDLFKALCGPDKQRFLWDNNGKYIALQLLHALQYLHARHIVHLDLKPQNVLLDGSGSTAYIADLGMSALITQGYLTSVSTVGTYAWAAPELLLGSRVTTAADMYSYGVILWQLLTGRTPRRGAITLDGLEEKYPKELVMMLQCTLNAFPEMRPTATDAAQIVLRIITSNGQSELPPTAL